MTDYSWYAWAILAGTAVLIAITTVATRPPHN